MVKFSTSAVVSALSSLLCIISAGNVAAFTSNKPFVTTIRARPAAGRSSSLAVSSSPLLPPIPDIPPPQDIAYGEESRKYRRTVYSHDDWVKFRSGNRFIRNLWYTRASGIYKNVGSEVGAVTAVAVATVLYNCIAGGYTDLEGVSHAAMVSGLPLAKCPMDPFTLLSPSLGLLLVFRTKAGYQRWDEARKNWGMNINHTRDLVRQANAYYDSTGVTPEQRRKDLDQVALATWAFVRCMKRHLSPEWEDEVDFRTELYDKLPDEQAIKIITAAHRPNRALFDLSVAIENLPMHFTRKLEIHKAVTIFEDNLGSSERILTSPIPVFYSRHTARFLALWLLPLPLALWGPFDGSWNHIMMIPAAATIALFLFGIEELATQMEEPFTILPMQGFCDKIYNWCKEIMTFYPGDNNMPINSVKEEHNTMWDTIDGYNNGYQQNSGIY